MVANTGKPYYKVLHARPSFKFQTHRTYKLRDLLPGERRLAGGGKDFWKVLRRSNNVHHPLFKGTELGGLREGKGDRHLETVIIREPGVDGDGVILYVWSFIGHIVELELINLNLRRRQGILLIGYHNIPQDLLLLHNRYAHTSNVCAHGGAQAHVLSRQSSEESVLLPYASVSMRI